MALPNCTVVSQRSGRTLGFPYIPNLNYTANGSVALLQLGNTLNTNYTYDPLNFRLKTLQTGTGGHCKTWRIAMTTSATC